MGWMGEKIVVKPRTAIFHDVVKSLSYVLVLPVLLKLLPKRSLHSHKSVVATLDFLNTASKCFTRRSELVTQKTAGAKIRQRKDSSWKFKCFIPRVANNSSQSSKKIFRFRLRFPDKLITTNTRMR